MLTGTLFYFTKMTIDGVKRTAQEQMSRVLKEQSRFVYVSTVKQTIRFFFLGLTNRLIIKSLMIDCSLMIVNLRICYL